MPISIPSASSASFTEWVRPHWDPMARLARQLAPQGEAEDVLQDALTAAWRKRAQFNPHRGTPRNWLLAIVANQARTSHRTATRWRTRHLDADEQPGTSADPDLELALRSLTLRQRTAIVLHYYEDLPIADVAAVMRCAPGTVKSTLSDARSKLRTRLEGGE
jgi:RNA polymerase sigma factor (sigma-70 family)